MEGREVLSSVPSLPSWSSLVLQLGNTAYHRRPLPFLPYPGSSREMPV